MLRRARLFAPNYIYAELVGRGLNVRCCLIAPNTRMTLLKLSSGVIENRQHFHKSAKSRLASSAGGREDSKPLSTP